MAHKRENDYHYRRMNMKLTPSRDSQPEPLLKANDVARRLNVSRAFAYQLMKRGDIPTVEIKAARRVRNSDLENYIAAQIRS